LVAAAGLDSIYTSVDSGVTWTSTGLPPAKPLRSNLLPLGRCLECLDESRHRPWILELIRERVVASLHPSLLALSFPGFDQVKYASAPHHNRLTALGAPPVTFHTKLEFSLPGSLQMRELILNFDSHRAEMKLHQRGKVKYFHVYPKNSVCFTRFLCTLFA
jgi:hypothetical protein